MIPSITQRQLYQAVKPFLVTVTDLDPSLVIQGLPNRTAMPPASPGFVMMEFTRQTRLRTNIETWSRSKITPPTTIEAEQGTMVRLQTDFYGATAGDWAVVFTTLWRSEAGCIALAPNCQPLYSDDPVLGPLEDDEDQYEQRWSIMSYLQYNPVVSVPTQFSDSLEISLINVDERFPP